MPLNVMSSLPLLLLFSVKRGHQVAMLEKLIFYCTAFKSVNYDVNCVLFREVQRFIMSTNRFSMATV